MKQPRRIKVVANQPAHGQLPISELIGKEFDVLQVHRDDNDKPNGQVSVDAGGDWGQIVLQKAEYETVK